MFSFFSSGIGLFFRSPTTIVAPFQIGSFLLSESAETLLSELGEGILL